MDDTIDIGPAGEPGSIIPGGPAADDQPLSNRVGRDPSNLGDDIKDEGDVVFPNPDPPENNL